MRRVFIVPILLVLIVAASGCTNQQNLNLNKTYSSNGVSFIYPSNWTVQNSSTLQNQMRNTGEVLVVVGDGGSNKFGFAKLNISSNQRIASLSEWAANYNTTMKNQGSTYVSEKNLTVDGVDAYQITMQDSGSYVTDVFFVKEGNGYLAVHASPNNDQQTLDMIMKNLKVA